MRIELCSISYVLYYNLFGATVTVLVNQFCMSLFGVHCFDLIFMNNEGQ